MEGRREKMHEGVVGVRGYRKQMRGIKKMTRRLRRRGRGRDGGGVEGDG